MGTDSIATGELSGRARWSIMVVSLVATASSFLFINGIAFLIPSLQAARGIPLDEAGLLSSMPSWGMVATLVLWGYVLDRVGERVVMTAGSALTAAAAYAAASAHSMVLIAVYLFLGGMAAASCNTAGGRLVSAWFPPHQRGLAMGVRQTAQPLGIALGALIIPELAEHGPRAGLMFPALACALGAVVSAVGIIDPPRKSRDKASAQELANPYRGSLVLWRIHAVAGLMMMPQTVTVTFMLVWLIRNLHWSVAAAGGLVTLSQLLGALGRVVVGRWSDRIGSRMRPVRIIAASAAATLFLLAWADFLDSRYQAPLMVAISVIAVLDNGLEATAITEFAGPFWSGRALGIQNTAQRVMAAAGPPLFGALITAAKYPPAWILCGAFPLAAVPLVPTRLLHPAWKLELGGNPFADFGGGEPFVPTRCQIGLDSPVHPGSGIAFAEMGKQQRDRHDRRGRIGDALTGDIRCATVHGLEHRGIGPGGIDISARGQANSAAHRRGQVGDDVAEQVVGDDHVKTPRVGDQEDGGSIDVLICHLHIGVVLSDLGHDARPQLPGEGQHVGLVHQRQMLATPPSALERVGHHTTHPEGGVQAYLGGYFVGRSDANRTTGTGVGTFGPLAHHHEIDVGISGERTAHSRIQPGGPQVDVVIQLETQAQQQTSLQHTAGD